MGRVPLQDKKNILSKTKVKNEAQPRTERNNIANVSFEQKSSSYTSIIRLRYLTDKLSVQFYTDNLKTTLLHYKKEQNLYNTKVKPSKHRYKLVEWLITVHQKLHLSDETLYLTCNIIDRMFLLRHIPNEKLPLLTVSSLFIASKYEEVTPPSLLTFITLLNDKSEDVLQAEKYLLCVLDYKLDYPQPLNFIRYYSKADNYDVSIRKMSKILLECSLLSDKITSLRGSVKASAAYLLARMIYKKNDSELFWVYCDENKNEVIECVEMYEEFLKLGIGDSIMRKYKNTDQIERIAKYFEDD